MSTNPTPDFDLPPVVETVLAVEFAPLPMWTVPHFGLYWAEIKNAYGRVAVQPALPQTVETFGPEPQAPAFFFNAFGDPTAPRCWFIDATERRLIQLQNGRFILNWRKVSDSDVYPRYPPQKEIFEAEWTRFGQFVARNGLGDLRVIQSEVTYVNHIRQGTGWKTFADLPNILPSWSGRHSGNFLPPQESVGLNVRYLMPGNRGRLHVTVQHAVRTSDANETIQMNLTARCVPASSSLVDVLASLDIGHEWVVCGFADLTSPAMHSLWRRKV